MNCSIVSVLLLYTRPTIIVINLIIDQFIGIGFLRLTTQLQLAFLLTSLSRKVVVDDAWSVTRFMKGEYKRELEILV